MLRRRDRARTADADTAEPAADQSGVDEIDPAVEQFVGSVPEILEAEYKIVPIDSIEPSPENINEGDVGVVSELIDESGFYGAVLVQRSSNRIICGETRWRSMRAMGAEHVPVLLTDVDDDSAARIMLGDNESNRRGRYNEPRLRDLLERMQTQTDRELRGTGFDGDYLDDLRQRLDESMKETLERVTFDAKRVDGITFRFGDYSGKVNRKLYEQFCAEFERRRQAGGEVLLDDVLADWLSIR